jgi:hypothetical protein
MSNRGPPGRRVTHRSPVQCIRIPRPVRTYCNGTQLPDALPPQPSTPCRGLGHLDTDGRPAGASGRQIPRMRAASRGGTDWETRRARARVELIQHAGHRNARQPLRGTSVFRAVRLPWHPIAHDHPDCRHGIVAHHSKRPRQPPRHCSRIRGPYTSSSSSAQLPARDPVTGSAPGDPAGECAPPANGSTRRPQPR